MSVKPIAIANIAVKIGLLGLLALAVLRPEMQQFQGKAMTGRALTYPIAVVIVPLVWVILRRNRPGLAYPHVLDMCLALPFLIDTAGNALDLYDSIDWWDDLNHFGNWAILTFAFGQLLFGKRFSAWVILGLAVGFGAIAGIMWEIAEYFTFVRNSPELATAYTDTLGDLALDLTGALLAALITIWLVSRRERGVAD
ncbi:MAG TPA: hypothetical protein PK691_05460, partial [Thermomicrobiales bacterium]|nr:hypothetical protein [Thermomicrobiales bacterium]